MWLINLLFALAPFLCRHTAEGCYIFRVNVSLVKIVNLINNLIEKTDTD